MVPQIPTFFRSVPLFLMILTIEARVSPCRVKKWFILFGHLKNGSFFIFSRTRCTGSRNTTLTTWVLVDPIGLTWSFRGRTTLNRSDLKSLLPWGITFTLPFPCCWSSLTLLYLSIRSISWRTLVTGLPVKDFLSPCSLGRPTLKVLIATSSKLPFISLYISQYQFKYAFRVSPSRMDRDSCESKGLGTLLHVTKQNRKLEWTPWRNLWN